ncbi:hypothetical protein F0267_02180 [Vibrio coralliilyticus]|uniref:Uncharacterized protein n=2 Tax=Vibrio TaxID=662 RepID=A0AAN0W031_9VIBR|nr:MULTISPECIES: PD-(D/E)XK nuclease-like domain-containing protein [Vibrio]AIW22473.1 hypothetical protein IX92_25750 [Vibrio coralliilyticus]MCZ2799134.1 PD-(D/E)XK nuclease-like domain-containing protein [Vibrio alginolyticus]NOH37034.1 hypothetical protein [Vibrio coralliilyticus]POB47291.1 hypothetical protein CRN52_14515 [Vibrio vulnificus]
MSVVLDNQVDCILQGLISPTANVKGALKDAFGNLTRGGTPVSAFDRNGKKNWITETGEYIQGVYVDMPDHEYHAIKGMFSSSGIKKFALDPHDGEAYMDGKKELAITPQLERSFNAGHLLHGLLLEPHQKDYNVITERTAKDIAKSGGVVIADHSELQKYLADNDLPKGKSIADRVAYAKEFNANVIYYPDYLDKVSSIKGKRYLCNDDWKKVHECAKVVKESILYKRNFENQGYSELTIIVFDSKHQVWIKARLDRVTSKRNPQSHELENFLLDVKTIHSLTDSQINRDLEDKLYSIQGAFYHYAAKLISFKLVEDQFALLFIEWDEYQRYQLVELADSAWKESVSYMHEIYEDMVKWMKNRKPKPSLNESGIMVANPKFYKLQRRVRSET